MAERYDRVVIGAGLFGLYAAHLFSGRSMRVAIIDADEGPLLRASQVNQARVHNGYHYPRSVSTASTSAVYYDRFVGEFEACVNRRFKQIYAFARAQSYMSSVGFERFCKTAGIPADAVDPDDYFEPDTIASAFLTEECSFDAGLLRQEMCRRLEGAEGVDWFVPDRIASADRDADGFDIELASGPRLRGDGVLNATYAGTNQVLRMFDLEPLPLKYELCELILGDVTPGLADVGLTVMDGPFFSVMPYGLSGFHSLTAVDYTPHRTSRDVTPTFSCQAQIPTCNDTALENCARCPARPVTAWPWVRQVARRFLGDRHGVSYADSLWTVKTVLARAELDDARPTLVHFNLTDPWFVTVFSGKIGTVYDLEQLVDEPSPAAEVSA